MKVEPRVGVLLRRLRCLSPVHLISGFVILLLLLSPFGLTDPVSLKDSVATCCTPVMSSLADLYSSQLNSWLGAQDCHVLTPLFLLASSWMSLAVLG